MSHTLEPYTVDLQEKGQLIIPEALCNQLNLQPGVKRSYPEGNRLTLTLEPDGSLRLVSLRLTVQKLQGIFKEIAPGVSLADELIEERRQAAFPEKEETGELRNRVS